MHTPTILLATFLTLLGTATTAPVAAPIAEPIAEPITDATPALTPRVTGYFPSITEMAWCAIPWHVPDCLKAQGHANEAESAAASLFPAASLHNGKGDAFRHCYWNARMAIDIGAANAKSIADNHENGSDGPAAEKRMDLANNASGRAMGVSAGTYAKAREACRVAAVNGRLVTLK
jgi:hypothetical protein